MYKLVWILTVCVSVVFGALAIHYRQQSENYRHQLEGALADADLDLPVKEPAKAPATRVVYVKDRPATDPDAGELQARIKELEHQLAGKEVLIASLRQVPASRPPDPVKMAQPMPPPGAKTNELARRAEFEKKREEFQQNMQNTFARKAAFMLQRDTSRMSEDEKKQYEQMVGLLDETWKMTALMQANLPPEQRHEVMHTVRDNIRALDPLLVAERNREFQDLGVSLGYNEAEAAQFVSYLTDVIDMTSLGNLFPSYHRGAPRKDSVGAAGAGNRK